MRPTVIGISGGIGSGKSVVSRILRIWGYDVFDCDSEAKALMDADIAIKRDLCKKINQEVVRNGVIDRALLSEIVFADEEKLAILNAIVHNAVRNRFYQWSIERETSVVFVESAILHSSGMISDVDAEWRVTAPIDLRVSRVSRRNNMTHQQVMSRISSQQTDEHPAKWPVPVTILTNDGVEAMLPQIVSALAHLSEL